MVSEVSPAPVKAFHISAVAWDVALDAVAARLARHPGAGTGYLESDAHAAIQGLDPSTRDAAWAELLACGIAAADGAIADRWAGAIAHVLDPEILLHLTSVHDGISGDADVAVFSGRALCTYRPRRVEPSAGGGVEITGYSTDVELSLFTEEHLWAGLSRVLPPVEELRAGAAGGSHVLSEEEIAIPPETAEALRSLLEEPPEGGATALDIAAIPDAPDALVDVVARREASLTAGIRTTVNGRTSLWTGMWAVADGTLYSIRSDVSRGVMTLVQVAPGNVASELIFALVGAHDFRASSQGGAA